MHGLESSMFLGLREFIKYMLTGRGLFLLPNPQIAIFCRSALLDEDLRNIVQHPSQTDPRDPDNIPDIEILPIPYDASESKCDLQGEGAFSLLCVLLRPKSSGTVRLTSTDARVRPACDLGSLTVKEDYLVMRKVIRLALRIGRQMREQGYPLRDLNVPQSESDTDLDDFIHHAARTTYHYSSTCRMAPEEDEMPGVVDDELRVHGVRGLRVADASVFPSIPATHLQAPAVMVAEKCADFLRVELMTR
jgi:choline dehydrogenase